MILKCNRTQNSESQLLFASNEIQNLGRDKIMQRILFVDYVNSQ